MTTACALRPVLAVMLVVVFVVTLAAPAPAEADVLTILAITSLALAGVIIIGYLVVANVEGAQRDEVAHPVRLACAGPACAASAPAPPPAHADAVQAP